MFRAIDQARQSRRPRRSHAARGWCWRHPYAVVFIQKVCSSSPDGQPIRSRVVSVEEDRVSVAPGSSSRGRDLGAASDVAASLGAPDTAGRGGADPMTELLTAFPAEDDSTPLAAQLLVDTRRRMSLEGRQFRKPDTTRIMTIANQKGGVGKTTTTVNLAASLAQGGLNVLVIDNDPQGNASTALGIDHRSGVPSVYEVLVEGLSIAETVQQCPEFPNLLVVPATIDLSGAEIELVSLVSRETRLRRAVDSYLAEREAAGEPRIDYVLVDCPPSLGLLTLNAFVTGREVLIPIQCEYYALEGLSQLLKTIKLIQAHLNPDLHVSTILLTMFDARTNLATQVASEVREHFGAETLATSIPRSVRVSEAPSHGQTVISYEPSSTGALAYREAARELTERAGAA
ncbi:AAA family ATPase [Sanguibacter keddieii]